MPAVSEPAIWGTPRMIWGIDVMVNAAPISDSAWMVERYDGGNR